MATPRRPADGERSIDPERGNAGVAAYEGLGAWVDVFDFAPAYQGEGQEPVVGVDDIDVMADNGVRTLYVQAARFDDRTPEGLLDPDLLAPLLARAHERGIRVVGWYLPKFEDVDGDLDRVVAIHEFDHQGQRFDGVALDIEDKDTVTDPVLRTERLIDLTRRVREAVGPNAAVGATCCPPSCSRWCNPDFWPGFPWAQIEPFYDVWMPMAYWSTARGVGRTAAGTRMPRRAPGACAPRWATPRPSCTRGGIGEHDRRGRVVGLPG